MVMASNMDHLNLLLLWYSGEYVPYWHFELNHEDRDNIINRHYRHNTSDRVATQTVQSTVQAVL